MLIIKILSWLVLVGSIMWFIYQPDFEPAIAIATSLVGLLVTFLHDRKEKSQANQSQAVAENGIGIQAGGDVSTGDIRVKRKENVK